MKVHISPEAQNDMQDIKGYIERELDNPAAAVNVVSKIIKAIRRLMDFPDSGTPLSVVLDINTDYRFLVSDSYLVFYRRENESVYVVRVLYGRRDYRKILFSESQSDI